MARLTYAQKFSFCETIVELLLQHKDTLNSAGLDVDKKITSLQEKNKKAVLADTKQETLKAELAKATEEAVKALEDAYTTASSTLDAMVGVLGKNDPLSKRLKQLRDQMVKEELRGKRKGEAKTD
jgi:hypothetical protein